MFPNVCRNVRFTCSEASFGMGRFAVVFHRLSASCVQTVSNLGGSNTLASVEETWASRDLPVLRTIVEAFDDPDRYKMSHAEIEKATGFDSDDVIRALRALWEAEPAYVKGRGASQVSYPLVIEGATERARVAAGQWPKPEDLADALAKALEDAAESAEPEDRSRLQRAAEVLRGTAKEIVIRVITTWGGQMGQGPDPSYPLGPPPAARH